MCVCMGQPSDICDALVKGKLSNKCFAVTSLPSYIIIHTSQKPSHSFTSLMYIRSSSQVGQSIPPSFPSALHEVILNSSLEYYINAFILHFYWEVRTLCSKTTFHLVFALIYGFQIFL